MKLNRHRGLSEAEHVPQMASQFHVAIPSKIGSVTASNRYAVESNLGYRYRLNHGLFSVDVPLGDSKKCAFKW